VKHHSLPPLEKAGLKHFKDLIFNEVICTLSQSHLFCSRDVAHSFAFTAHVDSIHHLHPSSSTFEHNEHKHKQT